MNSEDEKMMAYKYAIDLVMLVHLSIWSKSRKTWRKKALTYWDIYLRRVAASAYCDSLGKWLQNICEKMQISDVGRNADERNMLYEAIHSGLDEKILTEFRENTRTIINELRVMRQEIKEAKETDDENEEQEQENESQNDLFGKEQ